MTRRAATIPDRAAVGPDTPLRLDIAAVLAFPGGGMTAAGLRREHQRGNLAVERVAGKDYTTLAAIDEMRSRCRVQPKAPTSISTAAPAVGRSGSSETERARSEQAAVEMLATTLKRRLRNTSPPSIGQPSQVVKLPSRTS